MFTCTSGVEDEDVEAVELAEERVGERAHRGERRQVEHTHEDPLLHFERLHAAVRRLARQLEGEAAARREAALNVAACHHHSCRSEPQQLLRGRVA